jgi:hypothetical protein
VKVFPGRILKKEEEPSFSEANQAKRRFCPGAVAVLCLAGGRGKAGHGFRRDQP